jgi:glycosyltransferase involved in cell wall biosynthesis
VKAVLHDLSTFLKVLRGEGLRATADRVADRFAERRRIRSWPRVDSETMSAAGRHSGAIVLNVSPFSPFPRRGGSQIQTLDRLEVESELRTIAHAYPHGHGWRLERFRGDHGEFTDLPLPTGRDSTEAIAETIHTAAEISGTDTVHLENLHGLPLEIGPALVERELRVLLSLHDYSCFCRRPHLIEEPDRVFCDFSTDERRCRRCLASDGSDDEHNQTTYRRRGEAVLRSARILIFPSEFLRDVHYRLFPEATLSTTTNVIEPATKKLPLKPRSTSSSTHVALVGGLKHHKGGAVAVSLVEGLRSTHPKLRWTAFGDGEPELLGRLRRLGHVRIRGYYRAGALPALLSAAGIDYAVLASIWPETYGLVVDECLLAGSPVIAFDRGAVGERISRLRAGRLAEPGSGADGLARVLASALDDRLELPEGTAARLPRPSQAALHHMEMYASLIHRKSRNR